MRWMQSPPPKRILKDEIVYQACPNKNEMLAILRTANGDKFFQQDLVTCQHLPTWHDVTSLYGGGPSSSAVAGMMTTTFSTPYVLGLETCQAYCDMLAQDDTTTTTKANHSNLHTTRPPIIPFAGAYNTRTNYLLQLLRLNVYVPTTKERRTSQCFTEVPWSKHVALKIPQRDTYQGTICLTWSMRQFFPLWLYIIRTNGWLACVKNPTLPLGIARTSNVHCWHLLHKTWRMDTREFIIVPKVHKIWVRHFLPCPIIGPTSINNAGMIPNLACLSDMKTLYFMLKK